MSSLPDEEDRLPHCGHCLVPLEPAVEDGRPLWRCPECHIVAIAYLPRLL